MSELTSQSCRSCHMTAARHHLVQGYTVTDAPERIVTCDSDTHRCAAVVDRCATLSDTPTVMTPVTCMDCRRAAITVMLVAACQHCVLAPMSTRCVPTMFTRLLDRRPAQVAVGYLLLRHIYKLDSLRWFSQHCSWMPHFGDAHSQGAMNSTFELRRDFVQCTYPKFHHPVFTRSVLSCWQAHKPTNKPTHKQTDSDENIQCSSLRYNVGWSSK